MTLSDVRTRILASALLTAMLAFVLVVTTVRTTALASVGQEWARPSPDVLAACVAHPDVWADLQVGPQRLRAYDQHRVPLAPDAPPLPVVEELSVGEQRLVRSHGPEWLAVVRAAPTGPCTWIRVDGGPPPVVARSLAYGLGLGAFLAVLAVGLATYGLVVRPLLARIAHIRAAATRVGGESYRSGSDGVGDALTDIADGLDRSHRRILDDRDELVRRHEALERYMAELAHDLRTPLGSMLLALQDVIAAGDDATIAVSRRALQDASYLGSLVENLHQATRLRNGLDPIEGEVDLADVVRHLEVRFRALGAADGVAVAAAVPEHPVLVRGTPALVERALANLVHNAVTHGGAHVAVVLTVDGDRFQLGVADDGPGVAPEVLADLTRRTFRDDPARPRGGGLGLAITNEIADRVGWAIDYERPAEGGLRVVVSGQTRTCRG